MEQVAQDIRNQSANSSPCWRLASVLEIFTFHRNIPNQAWADIPHNFRQVSCSARSLSAVPNAHPDSFGLFEAQKLRPSLVCQVSCGKTGGATRLPQKCEPWKKGCGTLQEDSLHNSSSNALSCRDGRILGSVSTGWTGEGATLILQRTSTDSELKGT